MTNLAQLNRKILELERNGSLTAQECATYGTLLDAVEELRELAFIVETVAHLTGRESRLLPATEKARRTLERLK